MGTISLPIPWVDFHRAGHPPAFAYGQPDPCPFCVADPDGPLAFVVYGKSQSRGSKTISVTKDGRRYVRDSNPASYPWMAEVKAAAVEAMGDRALMLGPLRVDLDFYFDRPLGHYRTGRHADQLKPSAPARPTVAPDKGKLERGVLDAMEGIVYRNDAQVVEGDSRKFYGTPIRCEVRVVQL